MRSLAKMTVMAAAVALWLTGCAVAPDYEYVVDYQVIGDRTVTYIYIPGEESRAGSLFLDQAIALQICDLIEWVEDDGDDAGEESESAPPRYFIDENDCRTTRILKTLEYR